MRKPDVPPTNVYRLRSRLRSFRAGFLCGSPEPATQTLIPFFTGGAFRLHDFDANVDITSGRVPHIAYRLMLSTPEPYYPGVLAVGVSSVEGSHEQRNDQPLDENPNYRISLARQFPDLSMGIALIPAAPAEIVH